MLHYDTAIGRVFVYDHFVNNGHRDFVSAPRGKALKWGSPAISCWSG